MNIAGPSTLLARCCRVTRTLDLGRTAFLSTEASVPATPAQPPVRPRSSNKGEAVKASGHTPKGTNAKPPAANRPNRYRTTYGIPPLDPRLLRTGADKLDRNAEEKKQNPDFEKIWRLESDIANGSDQVRDKAQKELLALRESQSRRHPLWAFFREKRPDSEDEVRNTNGHAAGEYQGKYSLAYSLERPDASSGKSGRSWKADELRRKSFNDLHTLWYVLTIERNALATQLDEARRVNVDAPSYTFLKEQSHRCRKSMARIKYVLHERRRAAQEAHALVEAEKQRPEEPVMTRPAPSFFESVEPVAPTAA